MWIGTLLLLFLLGRLFLFLPDRVRRAPLLPVREPAAAADLLPQLPRVDSGVAVVGCLVRDVLCGDEPKNILRTASSD